MSGLLVADFPGTRVLRGLLRSFSAGSTMGDFTGLLFVLASKWRLRGSSSILKEFGCGSTEVLVTARSSAALGLWFSGECFIVFVFFFHLGVRLLMAFWRGL